MKRRVIAGIGVAMFLFAFGFIIYGMSNPQIAFPWSDSVTYLIYGGYLLIMITCFVVTRAKKK